MFDYQTMKLMHRHSDHEWAAMAEVPHHGQASHDPERALLRARVFRCTKCDEFVSVSSEGDDAEDAAEGESGNR
ncbi:MAG: hypothetical protein FIA92_03925 [Chloroflexi bacterium]|nr:hypothetical protein [Chloroflexota bacterium]